MKPRARYGTVFAVAALARLVVVVWAAGRIPPAGDGIFYETFARRLAAGLGFTWSWPDGAVTYAAHYPVGYPALLALAYRALGASPTVAMTVNAVVGVVAALAGTALGTKLAGPRRGLLAGVFLALHPALVLYTPALMTEGITGALVVLALAVAVRVPERSVPLAVALVGLLLGFATLVRPQTVLLVPVFGACAVRPLRVGWPAFRGALVATALAAVVCAPWVLRNCARMGQCGLSFNGGWNLLIGAQTADGAWAPVDVPPECATVWDEAAKDACFGRVARREIVAHGAEALRAAPRKLSVTFDYFGAAPWYLHAANPEAFPYSAKVAAGAVETVVARVFLLGALVAAAGGVASGRGRVGGREGKRSHRLLLVTLVVGLALVLRREAWPAYLVLAALLAWAGARGEPSDRGAWLGTAAVIASTAAVHAVFFGAGRYGLLVEPLVAVMAALAGSRQLWEDTHVDAAQVIAGTRGGPPLPVREESPSSAECDAG